MCGKVNYVVRLVGDRIYLYYYTCDLHKALRVDVTQFGIDYELARR